MGMRREWEEKKLGRHGEEKIEKSSKNKMHNC